MLKFKGILLIAYFSLCLTLSFGQSTLTLEIINLRNDQGLISLELLDEGEKSVIKVEESIKNKKCTIVFKDLENGKYAVRYIHDENSNGELDTNWLGIPKEGYGFSNEAYGFFGPKDFIEWLFVVDGNTTLILKTNY